MRLRRRHSPRHLLWGVSSVSTRSCTSCGLAARRSQGQEGERTGERTGQRRSREISHGRQWRQLQHSSSTARDVDSFTRWQPDCWPVCTLLLLIWMFVPPLPLNSLSTPTTYFPCGPISVWARVWSSKEILWLGLVQGGRGGILACLLSGLAHTFSHLETGWTGELSRL